MPLKNYKTGLNLSPQPPSLLFGDYLKAADVLPVAPAVFGHQNLIPAQGWGMLGNNRVGNCAIAGPMHGVMLWNAIAKRPVRFTTQDALDDYRDACGYVIGDASTDQGGDMVQVAAYWKKTGFRDASAKRHKIAAYLSVDPGNLDHLDLACDWFDVVGFGVQLPASAEDQFEARAPWSVRAGDSIEGYHYVPFVGRTADGLRHVVTWGADQPVEEAWLAANLKEVVAYVSPEYLIDGKSPLGFDTAALLADLEKFA